MSRTVPREKLEVLADKTSLSWPLWLTSHSQPRVSVDVLSQYLSSSGIAGYSCAPLTSSLALCPSPGGEHPLSSSLSLLYQELHQKAICCPQDRSSSDFTVQLSGPAPAQPWPTHPKLPLSMGRAPLSSQGFEGSHQRTHASSTNIPNNLHSNQRASAAVSRP